MIDVRDSIKKEHVIREELYNLKIADPIEQEDPWQITALPRILYLIDDMKMYNPDKVKHLCRSAYNEAYNRCLKDIKGICKREGYHMIHELIFEKLIDDHVTSGFFEPKA